MDATLAVGIVGIVASSATGLGGVWLGSHQSKQMARDLAQDQREWEEERTLRQRKVEAALKTDERLLEAATVMPTVVGPAMEMGRAMADARGRILNAFGRSLVLDDAEINERVRALDMAMLGVGRSPQSGLPLAIRRGSFSSKAALSGGATGDAGGG